MPAATTGWARALKGRTLGIWGYGKIGRLVAGYGKAFGMQVLVWGREASRAGGAARRLSRPLLHKEAFSRESDVLTLHLRLNDATRGIVDSGRPGAHEAERLVRQYQPRRTGRARGAGGGAETGPAGLRGARRVRTANRWRRMRRCCGWTTCWRRRIWAMSSRTATSCISAPRFRTWWTSPTARRPASSIRTAAAFRLAAMALAMHSSTGRPSPAATACGGPA